MARGIRHWGGIYYCYLANVASPGPVISYLLNIYAYTHGLVLHSILLKRLLSTVVSI